MNRHRPGLLAALLLVLLAAAMGLVPGRAGRRGAMGDEVSQAGPRFEAIDLFITPTGPLAAYQLEFRARAGQVKIVGIEGGDHPAYTQPPYYDPAAMQQDRVIIGALSTKPAGELPAARVRVARVHVMIEAGPAPEYEARLQTTAGPEARTIEANLTFEPIRAAADGGDPQ
ncbi:MAG: hypothetical protein IT436_17685 [Phycisphaerales bacterium]|nr:hypothetical protein [Phycisphaerales bacterium]